MSKQKVLVTGGAGFVGSVLVPLLLDNGYQVRVLDSLIFNNGESLIRCFINNNFEFIKGDIRDSGLVKQCLKDVDVIIHLAAIVGYPACKKDPRVAKEVNLDGTKIINDLRRKDQLMIYSSTSSNYGHQKDSVCNEETVLNPLSLYGETKTEAEKLLKNSGNYIIYRFATGFGLSSRLRLDLMINDCVFQVLKIKQLVVYEKHYKRAFVHVTDMANSFLFALQNTAKMQDQIFNIGSEELNLSKEEIVTAIKNKIDYLLYFTDAGRDEDQRNYSLSYDKMKSVGFKTSISLDKGLDELVKGLSGIKIENRYSNV